MVYELIMKKVISMSFSGKIAYKMMMIMTKVFPTMKTDFTDVDSTLEKAKRINERNKYVFPSDKKAMYKEVTISNHPCIVIRSRKAENKKNKALLFIYGGETLEWKSEIAMARRYGDLTGMDVWCPIYPPITEVNITVTISVLYETYRAMAKRYGAENIAIVGDSMGGLFAAGIINHINRTESDIGMPKLFIANSPSGVPDTAEDWREMEKYASKDPIFTVNAFRGVGLIASHGQETPKDTYCPVYMDFRNAPDTYMYFAEELCAGNARAYKEAYDRAGAGNRLHIHIQPEMMHGYSCMPVFPESKKVFNESIRLLNEV